MVSLSTWFRYIAHKLEYSVSLSWKSYKRGQIADTEMGDAVWKNLLQGKLTYVHWYKGEQMAPTIELYQIVSNKNAKVNEYVEFVGMQLLSGNPEGGFLCIDGFFGNDFDNRKPCEKRRVFVGDVVVLKDPQKSDDYLVRRLAAIEGYEMVSKDEKDEPFILEKDQCWVVADNENILPKEAQDSRMFGPVPMTDIVGRVIYCLRTAVDHGPVQNSHFSMKKDSPVMEIELDVDEMAKNHKA
uniref:Peptidase S26 domain-containing protein n=1 Tax=Fagus sylvatica TaxID=28930 RepID=A0A2N9IKW4_FAGSY